MIDKIINKLKSIWDHFIWVHEDYNRFLRDNPEIYMMEILDDELSDY